MLNGGSGSDGLDERKQHVARVLEQAGRRHEFLITSTPSELPDLATQACKKAHAENGAVVVAGGDGSINTVVKQILGSDVPLGLLPQGTFNYNGRNRGIPEELEDAVRALLRAHVEPVQVGRVNDEVFMVNASLGLYPQLLEDREGFKQRFGRSRLVAMVSGLVSLLRDYHRLSLEVECDGDRQVLETSTLVVGNNRLQLEQIGIDSAAQVEQGRLVGIAVSPIGAPSLLWLALRGLMGRLGDDDNERTVVFRELCVRSLGRRKHHGHIKVAVDGELCKMSLPLRFRVDPSPLQLLVPHADDARREAP
ncbi:diacylglycerol kinase family protein [Oleiagrimonas sp. C23AA]|uniref:diacylglycerol kinase family protein n=1 Tax=Oleiagrimonas sp. C23AA TaxID=2719047 RepID=UPI00197D6E35